MSALQTVFQMAPRLFDVVRNMRPTWHLPSLFSVDETFLLHAGIRGIVWDVDGTLTGDRRSTLEPEAAGPFHALLATDGLRHVIVSNAGEDRYRELGSMFPTVPVLRGYRFGPDVLYRRLLGDADSWSSAECAERLAAGARVIRKPSAELVAYAVRELGCGADAVVMIGDQYTTDVVGASLGGIRSIKLPTLARATFRPYVRLAQRLEAALYAVLYERPP